MGKIVVLATGGTIAGEAASAADAVGYQAAQRPVEALLAAARVLGDGRQVLEAQQLAQIDSKDMGMAVWQQLAQACADALARGDVRAVVITHGTDTLEETAYFLQCVLAAAPGGWQAQGKAVVLTAAMRPATARLSDGPQNLADALTLASDPAACGVLAVVAGKVFAARDISKIYPYRLDAFSAGDAGLLAWLEEGEVRWLRAAPPWPRTDSELWRRVQDTPADDWPWVELLSSHAGSSARALQALVQAGVDGLVLAGTGNATVHHQLEQAAVLAQQQGVPVWRSSRCLAGQVVPGGSSAIPLALQEGQPLSPVKARIALSLQLLLQAG